jgi:hypothetical protein
LGAILPKYRKKWGQLTEVVVDLFGKSMLCPRLAIHGILELIAQECLERLGLSIMEWCCILQKGILGSCIILDQGTEE